MWLDKQTSAKCKARDKCRHDKHCLALIIIFIKIFSISGGPGRRNSNTTTAQSTARWLQSRKIHLKIKPLLVDNSNTWNNDVIKAILANEEFCITEVNDFKSIQSLFFDREIYPSIISTIKNGNWDSLKELEGEKKNGFAEYLDIIIFSDENNKAFVATIYDSDELWQDPEIIDIIKLT